MEQITLLADVYPLTERQKVLLLDAGYVPDAKELTERWNFVLRGRLSETIFAAAWENVCERHVSLCTALIWKRVKKPLQFVKRQARMPLKHYDWRELTPTRQFAEFVKLIRREAEQGFNVAEPPLVRLCLCRTADETYQVVCSYSSLLFDRRSIVFLFREALRSYAEIADGRTLVVDENQLSNDYVHQLQDSHYSSARDWWTTTLEDFRASTFTAFRGEQQADTERFYGEAELKLDQSLVASLQRCALTLDISFDTLLRSAWAIVLGVYTGAERVTFGVDVEARLREESGAEIELSLDTLPLRVDVESRSTVSGWLKKQDARWVQLSSLAPAPTALIRHWAQLNSNISLFDSRIVLQPLEESNSGGLIVEQARAFALHDTPLIIELVSREPLKLRATYATHLLDSAAATRLLRHYEQVLLAMVERPEARVGELELLTEAEREQLREWNETAREYGRDRGIAAVFEEQARQWPEAIAIVMGERSLTYEELNRRANQVGHYLQEFGVGPEVCVGLCLERSLEMVVGMLGILKAGGAYVPLDASYPTERLTYMLSDAGVAVVLTQESLLDALPSYWGQVVSLDEEWEEIKKRNSANVVSGADGESLAYVMYTSGSTGEPKGVAIVQRGVVRLVKETNYAKFGAEETFVQLAPLTFDASTFEVWGSLLNGGRLVVMPPDSPSLEELGRALQQHQITTLWLTAGLFHLMANSQLESLLSLRQLLAGGDVLSPHAVNRVLEVGTSLTLINGYGPTENTTFTCCYPMQSGNSVGATVPIGTPISNTKIYILDRELRPVPIGVAGELYIGGDGLARGYYNCPELTAERFVPDRFSSVAGARLYRSGDRVRFLTDGNIEFLGRVDYQVKVRGHRIELGEIETVLATHGAIKEVVVEAREDRSGDKRLVAYVVCEPDAELSTDVLRRFLIEKLPDYMLPNSFVMLDNMPLTDNGKVDRKALPEPDTVRPELVDSYVASRTEVERQLSDIWSAVLGIERIGVNDDFFELGGHSLTATQLISTVREKLQIELPLRCIFDSPTVAGMAEHISAILSGEQKTIAPVITPAKRDGALPLSFAQRRMWFLNQFEPESAYYNVPLAMRLTGRLDRDALEEAINEVIRRHEVLRTTITTQNGEPVQVINDAAHLTLTVEDISKEGEERAVELAAEESAKPFNLSRWPLLRIRLLKLGPEDHVALFTVHHIISDGWSMGVLVREVSALYAAFVERKPSPLPELTLQYADFAAWQQEYLRGNILEDHLQYWKKQLSGAPTVLDLPTDKPRPAVQKFRGANKQLSVPKEVTEQLLALSRQEGATLFMTLLAAFNVLLYRYTGQQDILVGSPIANRNRAEIEGLIGFFVNTLVLRAQMGSDQSFRSLLRQIRTTTLDAYAHQDLPFENLVQELQPERDMSRSPLFQAMLVLQNAPQQAFELPGLTLSAFATQNRTAKFDLMLMMAERANGLDGTLEYDTDLFDARTIEQMLSHFQRLLENIVAHPDQRVTEFSLLTADERQRLLVEWNATTVDYPRDVCLHELIEAQAERTPHAVALISDDERLSYQELNRRANRLAHRLRALGVGPESVVAMFMERSVEVVVSLLGVLKSGGAYLPLEPSYPRERLELMLEDARPPVLLTQPHLRERLPAVEMHVLELGVGWGKSGDGADEASENVAAGVLPDNAAYVIYTSGSTGRPKAVVNVHRAICNRLLWMQDEYRLSAADIVLQKTPFSFDVSVWEFAWPLLAGARLVVARSGGHQDPAYLVRLIRQERVTVMHFVPSMLQVFLQEEGVEECESLRDVLCGGEALAYGLQERFFERLQARLHNLYGPAEAAIDVTYWKCRSNDGRSVVPIGKPIANTQIYLLDEQMGPVPLGVAGELHIGGIGLARGYMGRPELTAEKFIPDPFSAAEGSRLYRTGDLARYLADGNIEFLGRLDHQIKLRGVRIEPGEIEATLRSHPAVREAVAVVREFTVGDPRLVVYAVVDGEVDQAALREFLRGKLPEYLLPSAFVLLEKLPLLPSGKLNKNALPAPEITREAVAEAYVAPRNAMEEMIAAMWSELLGVTRVGVYDNFFALGGHSLLAARIIVRVRDKFAVDVPLRSMFDTPNVAGLAEHVDAMLSAEHKTIAPVIVPAARDRALPLSFAQRRMWFLNQFEPESAYYNIPIAMRLTGRLDTDALEEAINEIIRRHEMLRTTIGTEDGEPVQVINDAAHLTLTVEDISKEGEAHAVELAAEESAKPFNLSRWPLLRIRLLKLGAEDHVALFTVHHIISDGWSMGVLVREVATLYAAFVEGEPSPLPELTIQYADFAAWQQEYLRGNKLEDHLQYWKKQLSGAPTVLDLPTDKPRPAVQKFRGANKQFSVPKEVTEQLLALSRQEGATLFMTLLAAFNVLLYRYTGQQDILVGSPIANRNRAEIEELIGFFVNTLVLRAQMGSDQSFRSLLRQIRTTTLDAYAHQDLPFENLVQELQPERDMSRSPLFQAMLVLQNAPQQAFELPGLTLSAFATQNRTAKFDLMLTMAERANGLNGTLEYDTDLFGARTIEQMLSHFQRLLENIVAHPDQRLAEFSLLTADERQRLLVEWNATTVDYPRDVCLHELIEAQAERTPHAVALISDDERLSYQELNSRANRLAHYLRDHGVGSESVVGVLMERSNDLIAALLGVLKAGGAYVPLDPAYPRDRLQLMLEDAGITLLLTQSNLQDRLLPHDPRVISIDEESTRAALNAASSSNPKSVARAENLIYLLYTSGSTGVPKGVLVTHRGIVNCIAWMQRTYALNSNDRFLFKTSLNFDASVWEVFWPLTTGAAVVVTRPGGEQDGPYLVETMRTQDVTCVYFVPSILALWLETPGINRLPVLRYVICGGESLSGQLLTTYFERLGERVELHHSYGPTETSIASAESVCSPLYRTWRQMPVGRALANTKLYVLDTALQLVPLAMAGELCIGGDGVARGYLHRPELTATAFIPDPFSTEPGARLYRTGDRMRYLHDGQLEFLGRVDDQVKLRGVRIEPGEIEATLRSHPAVREAVALVREFAVGDPRLVVYAVVDAEVDQAALREFLRGKLPEYLLPSAFVLLEKLPLLPSGKVDKNALPAPEITREAVAESYVAPRNAMEEMIAAMWSELLGVTRVGVYDNFFALGGHSLLAARIIVRVRDKFAVDVPLRSLFETPNVAGLANAVMESQSEMLQLSETKDVLAELQSLSEEEAQSLVAAHRASS